MHDERDAIIYVGKAISLKNRVRQYFQSSRNKGVKIEQMVTHIARFEYIITDSELEALVLECNLIKEHRPKYNTMLMDDKAYPFIKVTVQEDFPRVLFARQMYKDKAKYYGPYTSAAAVKDTIDLIHKLYGIRTCTTASSRSFAIAITSLSSISLFVIFCFCAIFFTLPSSSRYSMAFSNSISSAACCIFSSSSFKMGA